MDVEVQEGRAHGLQPPGAQTDQPQVRVELRAAQAAQQAQSPPPEQQQQAKEDATERERVRYNDPSEESGFLLNVDTKWKSHPQCVHLE